MQGLPMRQHEPSVIDPEDGLSAISPASVNHAGLHTFCALLHIPHCCDCAWNMYLDQPDACCRVSVSLILLIMSCLQAPSSSWLWLCHSCCLCCCRWLLAL